MKRSRILAVLVALVGALLAGCSGGSSDSGASGPSDEMSVNIEKIGAQSSLIPLGLKADRTIETPSLDQVEQAGYFSQGPKPGDVGPAVILGHINGKGKQGVFSKLAQLKVGDKVNVTRDGRNLSFTVTKMETVPKGKFPTAQVYSDTTSPELRVITCGGDLDRSAHSYLSNVIAFAKLDA